MYAVVLSLLCRLAFSAAQVPSGAASDRTHISPLLNQADETSGPLRLKVTELSSEPHEFPGVGKSYGVTITNTTDSGVSIERGILIERKTQKGWSTYTEIQALVDCTHYVQGDFKPSTSLAARSSLAVYSWNGPMCGGQCVDACMQNALAKPGTYRFVVILLPDRARIVSPPFTIPGP